jgi:anti-anti-sigma factor
MQDRRKVIIEGTMTIYDAAAGKKVLFDALEGAAEFEVDLSGVTEMDSAGLQLLVAIKREAAHRNKRVHLVAHSPAVLEVLDCYGLAAYFGDAVVIPSDAKARRA